MVVMSYYFTLSRVFRTIFSRWFRFMFITINIIIIIIIYTPLRDFYII